MSLLNVECPKMLLFLPHNAWFDCNYNTIMQLQLNYVSHFLVATYCFRPVSVSLSVSTCNSYLLNDDS
jgi:hypothetical protein